MRAPRSASCAPASRSVTGQRDRGRFSMMSSYVALLRAVNLGPHKRVAMDDLRDLAIRLGYEQARTLINSGNLVFRARSTGTEKIEAALETEAKKRLELETEFYVRSSAEWDALVAANPYPD